MMKNKEIEELLKGMRDVSNTEGAFMNLDRYLVKLLLSYIEQLENNRDKAIEYIEKHLYKWYDLNGEEYTEPREFEKNTDASILIDILKGDSDE